MWTSDLLEEACVRITRNIGMLLLAIYLILVGLAGLGLGLPGILMTLIALAAGVFILLGR